MTEEHVRLNEAKVEKRPWKKWGPYLSERQWGTVREDYSRNGRCLELLHPRSCPFPGLSLGRGRSGGSSDDKQRLCFALALWNGKDPILKERLFGLTNSEGNHGEDVKEYYFYLDSTPTHSYMKFLYKYPQAAYPYADLVETNRRRNRDEFEYELLDTGVFNDDRYFDVFVEYAKASPEDILIRITACNRGTEAAELHVLPTLWFRNDWAPWIVTRRAEKPLLKQIDGPAGASTIAATHPVLGTYDLYCEGDAPLLFTENETNHARLSPRLPERQPVRQGRHQQLRRPGPARCGEPRTTRHQGRGALPAADRPRPVGDSAAASHRPQPNRAAQAGQRRATPFGQDFDEIFAARLREADEFYQSVTPPSVSPDAANVMRQALAGMLWSKQYYYWDGDAWLEEHDAHPLHHGSRDFRNREWFHMINDDIISMPDKWEYPWYAAWDLAFHTLPIGDRRPRLRQGAAAPDAPRAVPPSERPASRLRVELQRREPAGARLGDPVPAPHRAGAARRGRLEFPQARRSTSSC